MGSENNTETCDASDGVMADVNAKYYRCGLPLKVEGDCLKIPAFDAITGQCPNCVFRSEAITPAKIKVLRILTVDVPQLGKRGKIKSMVEQKACA